MRNSAVMVFAMDAVAGNWELGQNSLAPTVVGM